MALGKKKRKMKRAVSGPEVKTAQSIKKRKKMRRYLTGTLAGVAVVAVVFFIWARAQGQLSVTENAVGSVFSPIVNAVNSGVRWTRDFFHDLSNQQALRRENDELKLDNEKLRYQISQLEEVSNENERLLTMLDAWDGYEALDPVFARVTARDPGLWFDEFTINVGTSAGVEENMAVVTGDGLVGRIYEAGLNYAKVMTIIDTRSSVATLIERTRGSGMMRGEYMDSSYQGDCYIYYSNVNDVIPGDTVITSGQDGRYPKGLYVGTVRAVSRQSDTSDQYIIVTPGADFQRLEEVLVLREVVENADEQLPVLPSPTPRPIATTTPNPNATPTPAPTDGNFHWPTATEPPVEPETTPAPDMVEDLWSEE